MSTHALNSSSGNPVVPVELLEHIIDYLRGECQTLLNCALTHRTLYPRAKTVLYITIHIRSRKAYNAIRRLRLNKMAHSIFANTEEFVLEEHPEAWRTDPSHHFVHDMLPTFAGFPLPKLHCLVLRGFHRGLVWRDSPLTALLLTQTFSSVRTLVLHNQPFSTLLDVVRFVCALPQLQELELHATSLIMTGTSSLTATNPATGGRLRLRRFQLSGLDGLEAASVLDWLARTPTVQAPTMRVLRAAVWPRDRDSVYSSLSNILKQLGSSLTDLDVELRQHSVTIPVLTYTTGLETLSLRIVVLNLAEMPWTLTGSDCNNVILPTLTSLEAPRLRTLYFKFNLIYNLLGGQDAEAYVARLDWTPLGGVIARKRLNSLQTVVIEVFVERLCLVERRESALEVLKRIECAFESAVQQLPWQTRPVVKVIRHRERWEGGRR
ncbi:hypothetical protein DAEQUDRAFT_811279 [Daedalea quercina L-15889]|uniref:F-box domain-containing protein n=1 Tax=Daedalea quercina L-15889 TaxID=1314783 RepID=A0A165QHV0_9APHY|nr:hypothetical protein DAEQUDRAFT_811279 [Daedalea quercina L-15889]